jgi:aryl-alcohol dehydrogenase-like predicted oxidoreductase
MSDGAVPARVAVRPLGHSDLVIPPIVLGGMFRDSSQRETDLARVIDCALEAGLYAIDTAPLYDFGESERLLGRLLVGRRGRVCLMSKVGLRWDDAWGELLFSAAQGGRPIDVRRDSRPEAIRRDVEESLLRLGCETLDLVQVHHRDRLTPIAETMGALARLHDEGKLRAIGVSNFTPEDIEAARVALGALPLASTQNCYSLLERGAEDALLPWVRRNEVGFLAYSPLAQGLLAGRLLAGGLPASDGRSRGPLFQSANVERIHVALRSVVLPIGERAGIGIASVALAWVFMQSGVTAAIVGAQDERQVRDAIAALELRLSTDEFGQIGRVFAELPIARAAGAPLHRRIADRLSGVLRRRLEQLRR